jgi:DNA-binding response OmpR family regulator
MKVLVAEDDRDFGNILTQYITISGFDVKLGRDGKEAWELFNLDKPDICVFDVMMPEMDGFTLAEKVKEAHPDVPVILYNTLELICGNANEKLTLKEAQLLKYFIINKNKILAREDILTEIWGEDDYFLGRSMDVFISRLRKYVSEDKNIDIRTVRGTGFILEEIKKEEQKEEQKEE